MTEVVGFRLEETKHGFKWGPLEVKRLISDPKWGVVIQAQGKCEAMTIRVTPGGRIRTIEQRHKRERAKS